MSGFLSRFFNKRALTDPNYLFLFDPPPPDEYVVFDTETTGLNPAEDEILSIGAVKIIGNKILTSEKFEVFVKPTTEIKTESIKIHHLRNIDVEHGLDAVDAVSRFLRFAGSRPLVGYHLKFDIAMINKYTKPQFGIRLPNQAIEVSQLYVNRMQVIDRIQNAYQADIEMDLRFDTIVKRLKVPILGKHDATNDAIMTALIFLKLRPQKKAQKSKPIVTP